MTGPAVARWPLITLRLVLLAGWLALCIPLYLLAEPFARRNPVPPTFLGGAARICGVRLSRKGPRPSAGSILLANHVSWLDILGLAGTAGTTFVAHDGLAAIGPLRWLCSLNRTVFIARHQRGTVARQVEQLREALTHASALTLFPEGTTSDGTGLLPFKSSLLSVLEGQGTDVPVHPVWLDYGSAVPSIAWTNGEPGLANALRVLGRWKPVPLTIHVLPPLEGDARAGRKAIAEAARSEILGVMTRGRLRRGE